MSPTPRHGRTQLDMENIAPLRLIVGREGDEFLAVDALECGHRINEASGIYGVSHQPKRRRCFYCQLADSTSEDGPR